jgi:hypothetical protein
MPNKTMSVSPRGVGVSCRNLTLRTASAAYPQAYSIRAQVPPKHFEGPKRIVLRGGVVFQTDQIFCKIVLACQNDVPTTLEGVRSRSLEPKAK